MGSLVQDFRQGLRVLAKSPGFMTVAVITLALGVGANTAIFSVVNGVLLRPPPFQDPDRLVLLWQSRPQEGMEQLPVSYANLTDWQEQSRVFEGMAAFFSYANSTFNLSAKGDPERVQAAYASENLFPILGVRPSRGRGFLPEEDRPGGERVVLLSHAIWQRRFGADADLVGKTVTLDGQSYAVAGIMPRGFAFPRFPRDADLWLPLAQDPNGGRRFSRGTKYLTVLARLQPGVTLEGAQTEMDGIARRLERQYPDVNRGIEVKVVPLHRQAAGDVRTALLVLLGAVGFVLLISCANVANLLLAKAAGRRREIAVRAALGADRLRIVRLLLSESLILALLGGGLGLLLALWGVDLLALLPFNAPAFGKPYQVSPDQIGLDGRVLGFTLLLSLLAGVLFGLLPAVQASRGDLHDALKQGDSRSTATFRRHPFRRLLVVAEIALSLVLLIGAALLIQSFRRLQDVPPGFNPENVLTLEIGLPRARYVQPEQAAAFFEELLVRLRGLPGVRLAAAVDHLPLSGADEDTGFYLEGRPAPTPAEMPHTHPRSVSPEYFRAMGIRLLDGRPFGAEDGAGAGRVAIVNQTMARRFWPGENPVGKRIALDYEALRFFPDRPPVLDLAAGMREIVGVVADVRHSGLDAEPAPEMYTPFLQLPSREMSVVLRGDIDPAGLAGAVRREVRSLDPNQAVSNLRTMDQILASSVARPRFNALLLALFAAVGLILAVVGVYGVTAHAVSQRTHEIGVRMALGARRGDVLAMILKEGLGLALAGLALGLAGALALTRVLSGLLFGVNATDPGTFALVALLLGGVALLACYLPARRATKVDPMTALRCE